MALNKGFLRPGNIIYKYSLYPGIAVGLIFSFGLYGFFYFLRESIRIAASQYDGRLIVLSPEENFYYNLFYGSLAAIIGFSITVKFIVENSIDYNNIKVKRRQRHILNENSFNSWTFLYAFARITAVFGIWYLTAPLQYDINFLQDFSLLLILLPIVLFLNIWPVIIKAMGRKGYRLLGYGFLYVSVLSIGFANINLVDYKAVNKKLIVYDIASTIHVPQTTNYNVIYRSSVVVDIYVLNDSMSSQPMIFWNDATTKIELKDINWYVNRERNKISEYEQNQLIANLHIDENVKVKVLSDLQYELRKANLRLIQYSTGIRNSKYPASYPLFKNLGMKRVLYPHYPSLEVFLDSAESLDYTKYTLKIPDNPMYRTQDIKNYNRIEIAVYSESVHLNGTQVSDRQLKSIVSNFIKKYSPNFVIIYSPDESIFYGKYIQYLDMLYSTVDKLRSEMSIELYKKPYHEWIREDELYEIKSRYPLNIVEWTTEEKRLMNLMEKIENRRVHQK